MYQETNAKPGLQPMVIAFRTDVDAYALPLHGQPRFLSLQQAGDIPLLQTNDPEIDGWQKACARAKVLSNAGTRQRLYLWWMSLPLEERSKHLR